MQRAPDVIPFIQQMKKQALRPTRPNPIPDYTTSNELVMPFPIIVCCTQNAPEGNRFFSIAVLGCALTGSNAHVFFHISSD